MLACGVCVVSHLKGLQGRRKKLEACLRPARGVLLRFRRRYALTSQSLNQRSRKPKFTGSALEALNILYVLVAIGSAKTDHRHKNKQLFFNLID